MQWKGRVIDKIKGFQQCWNDELLMEGRVDMREISLCDPQIEEIRAKKNYNDLKHIYIEERDKGSSVVGHIHCTGERLH